MQKKTFTKTWRCYTPSLAKKDETVYYDWSNEQDGTRIMEVWTKEVTGHNYLEIRITRNSEDECDDEMEGQVSDGYFEDYPYCFKGRVMSKRYRPSALPGTAAKFKAQLIEDSKYMSDADKWIKIFHRYQWLVSALLSVNPNNADAINVLTIIGNDMGEAYKAAYGWGRKPGENDEIARKFNDMIESNYKALLTAFDLCIAAEERITA